MPHQTVTGSGHMYVSRHAATIFFLLFKLISMAIAHHNAVGRMIIIFFTRSLARGDEWISRELLEITAGKKGVGPKVGQGLKKND